MAKLSAAQRARIRRLSQPRELSPDEEGGELNIVPFLDIVVNILIFVLATVAVTFTTSIETTPPGAGGSGVRDETPKKTLGLTVLVVSDGLAVKAEGGNVGPGCVGRGAGLTLPNTSTGYDLQGLQRCARELKSSTPEYSEEEQAYVSANPDIPYSAIVDVIDALRNTPTGEILFPSVAFKVSK